MENLENIIKKNMGLAGSIMKRYHLFPGQQIFEDCQSACKVVIVKALQEYPKESNNGKKFAFTTFLYHHLQKAIQDVLRHSHQVSYGCYETYTIHSKSQINLNASFGADPIDSLLDVFMTEEVKSDAHKTHKRIEVEDLIIKYLKAHPHDLMLLDILSTNIKERTKEQKKNFEMYIRKTMGRKVRRMDFFVTLDKIRKRIRKAIGTNFLLYRHMKFSPKMYKGSKNPYNLGIKLRMEKRRRAEAVYE